MSNHIMKTSFSRLGPAFLVYLGCMEPGRWATAMEAGSRLGLELVWVLISACAFSALLQSLSNRLGLATGKNLAQICGDEYPRYVSMILWFQCEVSILILDLSTVLGIAIILNSLLDFSMISSVIIAAADSIIFLLFLPHLGLYKAALLIASIMGVVLLSFTAETLYNNISSAPAAFQGLIPMFRGEIIYIASGILGSNIVPTNIYLQSALFENGKFQDSQKSGLPLRYSAINITAASGTLFLVILAVLSSAAAIFHNSGHVVVILQDAQALMEQVLSNSVSPVAFGFSFICASQISTLSGTMAGQVAAQGLLGLKLPFVLHHIFTRLGATISALFLVWSFGSEGVYQVLIFLQVILTLQLPFVIVPLVKVTSSQRIMGNYRNSFFVETISWICCAVIYVMDVWVMFDLFFGEYDEYMISGSWNFLRDLVELSTKWGEVVRFICCITTVGLATSSTLLLMWMISTPFKVRRTKQLMRSVSAPLECIPEISEEKYMEAKKTFQEFDLYNDHVLTEVAKADCSEALEADELANDPSIMSTKKVVEEVQSEVIPLDCAENLASQKEPYVEAKVEVSTSSVDDITFHLCNQGQEIQSKTNMKEIPDLVSTPISGDTFPSVNSCSKNFIPLLVPSSEPNKIDQHDAGKSDANRDIEHPKQTDEEVDGNELFDKDDDYIDGWETLEQDNAFQRNPSILGISVNSSTLEEPGSEKSFSARSDASESSCGGSGSGSLSRLSGLGRSARRQFSGLLDEFWSKLYDLHGQTVALPQGKPGVRSFKASQMDTLGYYPSVGYNDTFGNLHTSKFPQKSWHKNAMGDLVDQALHSRYPISPSDSLDSLYPQSYSSHNLEARRYSSLNFPSSRDNVDNQPHTIHGYKMASYVERSRTFSMGLDVSPFIVERQRPALHEQTSHAATFNRLQVSSNSGFESNLSSNSSQSKFPGSYAKQRLFGNSSASNSFHNEAELLDMSRGTHRMPYTGIDASVWDPLVYRVTGELNIPHNDHKIVQLGEKDIVSPSYTQQPVSRGYFGINTNDSEGFKTQVETALSFDERAPLSFDEISPPQSRKDAFSIQSSSLWSTQPFEQLFGSSHSSTSISPNTTDMAVSQSGTLSSLILANDQDITILNALRICIRKLLKLDGSDWLFRFESGLDEDLIGTVAKREKVLLDADAKELYKVQTLNEQFLVAGSQKQFAKSDVDATLAASGVPHCGEGCVWSMELVVSFGVWCIHRILELALMESRPELWGKYTYVLNRLQGVLDPAFSKPRTISTSCICVISEVPDVKQCIMKDVGETGISASPQSWPWGHNPSIPKGKGASVNAFLDIIRVVELAIGSRKGRTGTAAGDVAFPKGKENLASVLKRYKRRLSSKSLGTTGNVNYNNNISSGVSNHRTLAANPLLCRS